MKTIRQIADEIGVSKQAVYKRYKGKLYTVCAPYAHTVQGVLYLSEQAEKLIKQDFWKNECSNGVVLEQRQEAGVVAVLQGTIDTLQGNVKLLKAVEKVKPDLEDIQPEKTLTGAVKGVTVEQVKELKAAAIRGAAAEQKVQELKAENQRLQQKIPSTKEKLKEAQERQRLENQNRKLLVQVECLEQELEQERSFSARLMDGVSTVMDFLDRHLPEKFRTLVERARELLPVPEVQQPEQEQPEQEQERGHTWGGMEL